MKSPRLYRLLLFAVSSVSLVAAATTPQEGAEFSREFPLTTSSETARLAFHGGLENIENRQIGRAQTDFRAALKADSNFALAHLFLAYDNGNMAEQAAELSKAQVLAANASRPEQLMVQWIAGWRQGKMVAAISAMNDLVAAFPNDKLLLFLAGRWMIEQRNYEGAQRFLERAVALDSNYPAPLSYLPYAYAGTHSYYLAFQSLDKYVALVPGEPNTEDSYGAISLMAGQYERAREHYLKALRYDSTFIWSRVGLGDTYLLMGREDQARSEYAKAIATAPSAGDALNWEIQGALTYIYADNRKAAANALSNVAEKAHKMALPRQEATCYRLLSEYAADLNGFLEVSRRAEQVLDENSNMSGNDRAEEMAFVFKARAVKAAEFGRMDIANQALQKVSALASESRNTVIQEASEGAFGGVLWAQKNFSQAIPHLQEDQRNPLSAARLIQALREIGNADQADELADELHFYHEPTIDDIMARRLLHPAKPPK